MKLGVDVFGGDHSPEEIIKAVVELQPEFSSEIVLYGDEEKINELLNGQQFRIVHAPEIVLGEDKPMDAVRRKKNSSLMRGLLDLKEKKIDGFVSAGNTGAVLGGSIFITGRIKKISRPALAIPFPTSEGMKLLIDGGANAECKPQNLKDFAVMGTLYQNLVMGTQNPKVAIVNNGMEEGKGTKLVVEATQILKETDLNFIGNIEGRDIPLGRADVIVTDGFTGNIILKLTEGVAKFFTNNLKEVFMKSIITKLGALTVKKGLKELGKTLDYKEYGGAPLLGIDGYVVKAHGSSDARAFKSALRFLEKYAKSGIVEHLKETL